MSSNVYILGPTCTGKSELAIQASQQFGGEIISCDSIQIYRDLNIGTAKPTPEQMATVPHHLLNLVGAGGTFTAGEFRRHALAIMEERGSAGVKHFFLVGGSGFYVSALERGMFDLAPVPEEVREQVRARMEREGAQKLYEQLRQIDPEYAGKIQPQDRYRIARGLEIWLHQRRRLSEIQNQFQSNNSEIASSDIKIALRLERTELEKRVRLRTQKMLASGLIEEVQGLLERGLRDWPPLNSVGYKETQMYLRGEIARAELEEKIVTSTMQLAKRQMTWFKRDHTIKWFDSAAGFSEPLGYLDEKI